MYTKEGHLVTLRPLKRLQMRQCRVIGTWNAEHQMAGQSYRRPIVPPYYIEDCRISGATCRYFDMIMKPTYNKMYKNKNVSSLIDILTL